MQTHPTAVEKRWIVTATLPAQPIAIDPRT